MFRYYWVFKSDKAYASGIFNNPFLIWGKYKRHLFKTTLTVSFQFHHTQMDGAHASMFLDKLQSEINGLFRHPFSEDIEKYNANEDLAYCSDRCGQSDIE